MRKNKVRKPRDTRDFYVGTVRYQGLISLCQDDSGASIQLNIKDTKRLYKWLGKVIPYLEQEKK